MNRHARSLAVAAIALAVVVLVSGACTPEGRACSPSDPLPCSCADGHVGVQTCDPLGAGYGACDCTLDAGVDAATSDGAARDGASADATASDAQADAGRCAGATNLPQSCPCTDASQCAGGVCHDYGAKGVRCTKPCTQTSDCPPPSTKCSPMAMVCNTP